MPGPLRVRGPGRPDGLAVAGHDERVAGQDGGAGGGRRRGTEPRRGEL